jgi:protocatechuate 3,4-dioxygenase beta subunit
MSRNSLSKNALPRRRMLAAALGAPLVVAPMLVTLRGTRAAAQALPATPSCAVGNPTRAQTEGPYFKPRSPERASLIEPGTGGTRLVLAGVVRTTDCRPVANALLDFWQADGRGGYDNAGFRMRGHQYADAQGRYRLETAVPGEYPGRTPHIHVKVQPPGGRILTTQLYFPDQPRNARDGIFRPDLLIAYADAPGGRSGRFDFVLG